MLFPFNLSGFFQDLALKMLKTLYGVLHNASRSGEFVN
jgi:hypothetical protein